MSALFGLDHPGHEGLDAVDHPPQVDAEHPFPVLVPGLLQGPPDGHPGVVAQHVHRAEAGEGLVRQGAHRRQGGHVGGHGQGFGARGGDLFFRVPQWPGFDIRQHQFHAPPGQGQRQRPADAAGRAGHHGGSVLEGFHDASLKDGVKACDGPNPAMGRIPAAIPAR